MSASEIEKITMDPPDFDIQNVSVGGGFDSHDELSVIEPVQVHDDIPEPTAMVDHEALSS